MSQRLHSKEDSGKSARHSLSLQTESSLTSQKLSRRCLGLASMKNQMHTPLG